MRSQRRPGHAFPARHSRARARAARRASGLVLVAVALLVTLFLTAFGSAPTPVAVTQPAPAERLLPAGPPRPTVVATYGSLRLHLPISQERVTAIAYHATLNGALALDPVGERANRGLLARLARRIFGGRGGGGLRYYQLSGGNGPETNTLDIGAPPGTDVYSPVDGTVVGISPYVIDGRRYGVRLDLQPSDAPSVVVSLTRLRLDSALRVGSPVTASTQRVGTVLDLSGVERQELASYT